VVLLLVGSAMGPALATPRTDVTITAVVVIAMETGTFTTTGGVLCPSGTFTQDFVNPGGRCRSGTGHFVIRTNFVCDGGSSGFTAQLAASVILGTSSTANWVIISGFGEFANLHGAGKLTGVNVAGTVTDTHSGAVHLD